MKMKRILLITLLLLAVLTIGAVSAEDSNATSDDLQVVDEGDDVIEFKNYDEDDHYIYVYSEDNDEEINLENKEDTVAEIYLPTGTRNGSFRIYNGEVEVARSDINLDDDHWMNDEDDDELLDGYLFVGDLNLTKIKNGDTLSFMFLEYKDDQYVEFKDMTVFCKVKITGSIMTLTEIDGDANIQVNDIDLNKTSENFTFVNVTERIGTFIITVETDNEEYVVFKENLMTTNRPYSEFDNEYGTHYYCFAFSLDDLNNYVAQNPGDADSFVDMINNEIISSGDEMYFEIYEDENDEDSEIASESWTMTVKDGKISFDDEEDKVDVNYEDDLEISMEGAWNETVILSYEVKKGVNGKIVIRLNDNQDPAFEKALSELEPDVDDEDYNYYDITIADLNITQAGEYVLRCYFYDENEEQIYPYDDEEDPETLVLLPSQIVTGENATIIVTPFSICVDENKTVITINVTDAQDDDEVIIYVDGNENPIIITFGECETDEDGNYTITSGQLKLGVGNHTLNITCKGTNSIGNVTILTDLEIEIMDETVYTTLNAAFVFISLKEEDITGFSDITGLVNVTITDSEGNVIATIEKDLENMDRVIDLESLVIRTNDMNVELNGTYNVSVRYYNGNKGEVKAEGSVTFKELGADDYGISINDVIDDEKIIIFDELPLDNDILVSIDGNEPLRFDESSLNKGVYSQHNPIYFINQTQLGLTDGPHSISVSIENGIDIIPLANVNVIVDLKENVDPELTISVANIEVGNEAIVLITTNSTFTGSVLVQVANRNLTVNVINGQGNVSVTGLDVGTYTATATFAPNAFFLSSVKNATFNVTAKQVQPEKKDDIKPVVKNTVKLTLKKVKVKRSAKKLVLKATLKINGKAAKGKKIIFKFKGKKYKAKTNKKGVAKATIKKKVLKKLKKGKKVTYTAKYGKITKKVTVKVKK